MARLERSNVEVQWVRSADSSSLRPRVFVGAEPVPGVIEATVDAEGALCVRLHRTSWHSPLINVLPDCDTGEPVEVRG